jgi:hypothetical protein
MASSVFTLTNRLNYLQAQVNEIIAGSDTLQDVIDNGDELQGSVPTLDQVIKYDGTNIVWSDLPAPPTPSLQEVITVNDDLQSTAPTLGQVIKYNGTNVVWGDSTPTLQKVLETGNTANGSDGQITFTGSFPSNDQSLIKNDNVLLYSAVNSDSLSLSKTQNTITNGVKTLTLNVDGLSSTGAMSLGTATVALTTDSTAITQVPLNNSTKVATTSYVDTAISAIPTPAVPSLSAVLTAGNSAGISDINMNNNDILAVDNINLTTINSSVYPPVIPVDTLQNVLIAGNIATGASASVILDSNTASPVLGTKTTLNTSSLSCVNKALSTTNTSLSSSGLTLGVSGSVLTASSSGLSSTNILNLNSSSQIDTNCSIRVQSNPATAVRATLTNNQLLMQNATPALQNVISSTSSDITNGVKTISMTVDGLSSTGAMSLGTATVNLTTGSTGITQTYPSNTTALATTQYVSTAISSIPAPSLQTVTNTGNTITNGIKTLTLDVNGIDSTGEIVISNNTGTTQLKGTTTATTLKSTNYDTIGTDLTTKILDSLTTGNLELGNNMTTGNINFGSKITTGNLYIMNDALATGDITMFNNSSSATGKLLVRGGGISTNTITASSEVKSLKFNALNALQNLDIGDNLRDTSLTLGRLMIAGGSIDIGSIVASVNLLGTNSTAITQTTGNNSTRIATTAFVNSSIAAIPAPTVPTLSTTLTAGNTANNSIVLSDGTITNTYTKNSIIGNDDLTITSAPTKLLKIGSGSATENVEIATQTGRSVVLHLGDGDSNIAGSGVHINNGVNSVGNTQINNGSGQTGTINIGNATGGTTTTNMKGNTNIEGVVNINGDGSTNTGLITIGNTTGGTTSLKSNTINIATDDPTDNLKQITIGGTSGSFDSNTTLSGKTTINKLATPLNPIYAYPITGTTQIGYTVRVNVGNDVAIPTALTTLVTLPSVSSGKWLISFVLCIKGGGSNNIGVNGILYKDLVAQTYSVTAVGPTGINTSNNIVITDDIAVGSTAVYSIRTTCNQPHSTSSAFAGGSPTITNAGYLQATRIA